MSIVSRVSTINIDLKKGEPLHISPVSDLHLESASCDLEGFQKLMRERNRLPNHRVFLLGDTFDLVVPRDLRRFIPSSQSEDLHGRDDWAAAALEKAAEILSEDDTKYDLITPGNHEYEFMKRHGFDMTSVLAHQLRCQRGGYFGVLRYRMNTKKRDRARLFNILYHHGAWGGRVAKGFSGARDWARRFEGWDVFTYGHNHETHVHREVRMRAKGSELIEKTVHIVNTSSWVHTFHKDGKKVSYAEKAGYAPTARHTPLLKVWLEGKDLDPRCEVLL